MTGRQKLDGRHAMNEVPIKHILEAALLAAGRPLNLEQMQSLFEANEQPDKGVLREALEELTADYQHRGLELKEIASGWRIQIGGDLSPWVARLWEEKPQKYTRAFLETLAIIAYRQPITRGEIENIRGVSVSTTIMKSLQEREWVRVVGHRDVPGRPAMYGTTREFLDYFNLQSLDELPTLAELRDIDSINAELDLGEPGEPADERVSHELAADLDMTATPVDSDVAVQVPLADAVDGGDPTLH